MSDKQGDFLLMPDSDAVLVFPVKEGEHARFVQTKTRQPRQFGEHQLIFDPAAFLEKETLQQRLEKQPTFASIATARFEDALLGVMETITPDHGANFMLFVEQNHLVVAPADQVINNLYR